MGVSGISIALCGVPGDSIEGCKGSFDLFWGPFNPDFCIGPPGLESWVFPAPQGSGGPDLRVLSWKVDLARAIGSGGTRGPRRRTRRVGGPFFGSGVAWKARGFQWQARCGAGWLVGDGVRAGRFRVPGRGSGDLRGAPGLPEGFPAARGEPEASEAVWGRPVDSGVGPGYLKIGVVKSGEKSRARGAPGSSGGSGPGRVVSGCCWGLRGDRRRARGFVGAMLRARESPRVPGGAQGRCGGGGRSGEKVQDRVGPGESPGGSRARRAGIREAPRVPWILAEWVLIPWAPLQAIPHIGHGVRPRGCS